MDARPPVLKKRPAPDHSIARRSARFPKRPTGGAHFNLHSDWDGPALALESIVMPPPTDPEKIVIFTGSGISAESGIATFRGTDGTWSRIDPMKGASIEAWETDPQAVLDFHNGRLRAIEAAQPNPGAERSSTSRNISRSWSSPKTSTTSISTAQR